jgi:hypothetical protein
VLIVAVAVIIAMSGGFRLRVGSGVGWRVALTSPFRLLLWAVAVAVVRHVAWPQSPIYRDFPARIGVWWRTPAVECARTVLVGTRPAILFVGYLAVFTLGYRTGGVPFKVSDNEFVNLQARWDTGWYLTIANDGYHYDPAHPEGQQNIVFFPAYPIATRVLARLFGGSLYAFMLSGTVVSLGAFFGALVYLFRFARELFGDDDVASASVWLLAAFPFAIFYSAMYAESIFLLGALGAFYHFRRGEYVRAGLWGLMVGFTRPNGCFLSIPLAVMALAPWTPAWIYGGPQARREVINRHQPSRFIAALAAAAMPGIGVLLFTAFVWQFTGRPLAWAQGHAAWGRDYNGLTILVEQRYEWLTQGGVYQYTANMAGDLLNVLPALFVIGSAWPVARRLGLPYAVFILINILPPLANGGFLSAGRLSSVLFPSFVWLGSVVLPRHRPGWVGSFMALQALNAAMFYTWRDLY